ncbi:hypothetical protein H4S01_003749, partial [Coemansia sp. RSA 2610]
MGLSEQKTRVLYASDPRNLNWSQDKGRFGFKMLEKMGWSEGKGLGLNEDGEKEHVKIKLKTNQFGIGADKKTIRNWLANADGFSELLTRLNNDTPQPSPESEPAAALPEPPREPARSRLTHRTKFRRMKQMAMQDARGLQEIFGVRSECGQLTPITEPASEAEQSAVETKVVSNTVETGVSMNEYFAQKIAENPALAAIYGAQVAERDVKEKPSKKRKMRDSDEAE